MDFEAQSERFIGHAIIAFADSCTRPKLTASCPFYRVEGGTPTCDEECRAIAEQLGYRDRPVESHDFGGLRLTGRAIPLAATAGYQVFDANRTYLQDRHLEPSEQSTTTLLLGVQARITAAVLGQNEQAESDLGYFWEELEKRKFPVRQAAGAGLALTLARSVVSLISRPRMETLGLIRSNQDSTSTLAESWQPVLDGVRMQLTNDHDRAVQSKALALPNWIRGLVNSEVVIQRIQHDEELRHVFSPAVVYPLSNWFGGLLREGVFQSVRNRIPSVDLFRSLAKVGYSDKLGSWFWDRHTQTRLEDWQTTSYALEWNWQKFQESHGLPRHFLNERAIDSEQIASASMARTMGDHGRMAESVGFSNAIGIAVQYLREGNPRAAADLFSGITELQPANADSWNNLGFCQLAFDPSAALRSFGIAAAFRSNENQLLTANHLLALHVLGRDEEAALLIKAEIYDDPTLPEAYVWEHRNCGEPLKLGSTKDVSTYLRMTGSHIREMLDSR